MRELMVFRSQVFRHLQQDWYDVLNRAGGLWSPKWREIFPSCHVRSDVVPPVDENQIKNNESDNAHIYTLEPIKSIIYSEEMKGNNCIDITCEEFDQGDDVEDEPMSSIVEVEEDELPELWIPGRVLYIYSHRGQYKAALVDRRYPPLRRIEVQGNIFADHSGQSIFDGLLEVISYF